MDSERVRKLQDDIKAEQQRMRRCAHAFGEAYYDPHTVTEGYGSKFVTQGSDCWTEFAGYHEVSKARWTRRCKLCGYEEHTDQRKPIVQGYEPDFGRGQR